MSKTRKRSRPADGRARESEAVVPLDRTLALVHAGLAAGAFALSAYLTYTYYQLHQRVAWTGLCDISATMNCSSVALSPYGTLLGLPLGGWGAWFYLVTMAVTAAALRNWRLVRSPAFVLVLGAAFSVAVSLVLAAISAFVIRAWCPFCIALYLLNVGMLCTSWILLRRTGEGFVVAARAELRFLRRNQGGIALATLAALAVLAAFAVLYPRGFAPVQRVCDFLEERAGTSNARDPAAIVIYSDYQCPHCKTAHQALDAARSNPRVRVVSRNFPLEPDCNPEVSKAIHPGACLQAAAAECAEEQGRLDDFAGRLFDSKARDEDALAALAEGLGLDLGAFRECLSSDRPYDGIRADVEAARNDGVTGTPSVFVEGRRVLGPITRNSLRCLER